MTDVLAVRPLDPADAAALSKMLTSQSPEYLRYFTPFTFDESTLAKLLTTRVQDIYLGLYWGSELVAFCMLRGWDEGYAVPAYGVIVAEHVRGKGLGRLTIDLAKAICRLRGSPRLMLKVHPDNTAAKTMYEDAGFCQTGVDPRNDNVVMHYDFP